MIPPLHRIHRHGTAENPLLQVQQHLILLRCLERCRSRDPVNRQVRDLLWTGRHALLYAKCLTMIMTANRREEISLIGSCK
jgi:hypothetical protein